MSGRTEGHDNEPVRGLPGHLPPGEQMLWQGAPDWKRLALVAFHVRAVALYFGIILIVAAATGAGMTGLALTALAAVSAVGLLALFAWLSARSTVYTLTSKRVVLRIGIALPTCINIPLKIIDSASVRLFADGSADVPLVLSGPERMGWAMLWPHARPWKIAAPEPMLRAVPDGARVSALLAKALADELPAGRRIPLAKAAAAAAPQGAELPA